MDIFDQAGNTEPEENANQNTGGALGAFDEFGFGEDDEFIAIVDDTVSDTIKKSEKTQHLTKNEVNSLIATWTSKIKMFYSTLQQVSNKLKYYARAAYPEVDFRVMFSHVNFFQFESEITSAVIAGFSQEMANRAGKLYPEAKQNFTEWYIDMTPQGFKIVEKFYFGRPENKTEGKIRRTATKLSKQVPESKVVEEVSCQCVETQAVFVDVLEIDQYFADLVKCFRLMDKKHVNKSVNTVADVDASGEFMPEAQTIEHEGATSEIPQEQPGTGAVEAPPQVDQSGELTPDDFFKQSGYQTSDEEASGDDQLPDWGRDETDAVENSEDDGFESGEYRSATARYAASRINPDMTADETAYIPPAEDEGEQPHQQVEAPEEQSAQEVQNPMDEWTEQADMQAAETGVYPPEAEQHSLPEEPAPEGDPGQTAPYEVAPGEDFPLPDADEQTAQAPEAEAPQETSGDTDPVGQEDPWEDEPEQEKPNPWEM